MDYGHKTSYQRALQNTFDTTYKTSYSNVDTYQRSPVYRERNSYPVPNEPLPEYTRVSYPYQGDYADQYERARDQGQQRPPPGTWRGFYDYESDQDPRFKSPPVNREEPITLRRPLPANMSYSDKEIITMPIEKKSCHACQEPEAYSPKNTNQLRCYHKYCDNCIRRLFTTTEPYGDTVAKYFHCSICPNSKTAGPSVLRFDPYGRRVVPLPEFINPTDPVEKGYNEILANPDDMKEEYYERPFCHQCFTANQCVNQLGCHHRFCDACLNKLHCTDNLFRDSTILHYFCNICKDKTPESKVIRFDPYGRRSMQGFRPQKPSYDDALRITFSTTYGNSYRGVDTIHESPVYSEREFYAMPPAPDITYERESYPYSDDYQDPPARYLGERKPRRKNYYDYNDRPEPEFRNIPPPMNSERIERRDWPERPSESEYMKRQYNQILANPDDRHLGPVARNECVSCRGPETQVPKCTNQLGCGHKYCDNCIRNLHATDGPFRDRQALYYYCAICKGSRTPSPKIIRFDPYGRRILKYKDVDDIKIRENLRLKNVE